MFHYVHNITIEMIMQKTKGYSVEDDLMPIMKGKVLLPNFEEPPLEKGIGILACGGGLQTMPEILNAKVPGMNSNWGTWARFFLGRTQGGHYDGTGYVMFYDQGGDLPPSFRSAIEWDSFSR